MSSKYDDFRRMMDEMMGEERNLAPEEKGKVQRHFSDPDIDKFYICGLSPHSALQNTKSDIGATDKKQDQRMKEMWEAIPQEEKDKYGYEFELMEFLQTLVIEADRRIKREIERIGPQDHTGLSDEQEKQVEALDKQIQTLQAEAEQLGEDGEVEKAQESFSQAETMKAKRSLIIETAKSSAKRLFVCEISGLVYSNLDGEQRLKDLRSGRMYRGWHAIREKLTELKAKNPPRGIPGYKPSDQISDKPEGEAHSVDKTRSPERDRRARRERSRSRSPRRSDPRDRPRDDRSRDRDRERERERERDRARDRRDYRDRDRDRDYRGRR